MRILLAFALAFGAADDGGPAALLKKTGFTLSEAVAKGAKEAAGATPVAAELEEDDGKVVYCLEFAQGDKIVEVHLDAMTGELLKKDVENEKKSELIKSCKITLSQGIESALRKLPGLAFSAEIELEDGKAVIEVQIVSDGKVHKAKVDPVSGAVLTVKAKKEEKK